MRVNKKRVVPRWLAVIWLAWVCVWAPANVMHYGPQNILWFCNTANFIVLVALLFQSRLLFSWAAVSVLPVQCAYTLDLLAALAFGVHPLGGTEYMFDAARPLGIRLLSLFHVVMPGVLLWALFRLGYDRRALAVQTLAAWVVLPICWLGFNPHTRTDNAVFPVVDGERFDIDFNINWVWGLYDAPQRIFSSDWMFLVSVMVLYPLAMYLPTHLALAFLFDRGKSRGRSESP